MRPCPNCNQMNPAEAAFCLNCAARLNIQTQQQPQTQQAPPQSGPFIGQAQQGPAAGATPRLTNFPTGNAAQSQKGLVAMILAIIALICCGPFTGIPAAILGWMELDAIKSGRSPESNKLMGMVGLWGGIAATVLHIVLWFFMMVLSALGGGGDPYYY